jgi:hypothetical protein
MSDISTLLMNQIRTALNALHNSGVGFIDAESSSTFDYTVDGRTFVITIEEGANNGN